MSAGINELMVDPVHLFLSLSLETVFRQKPLPITVSAVANMNIDVCKWVVHKEVTAHCLSGSGLLEEKPKKITFYSCIS